MFSNAVLALSLLALLGLSSSARAECHAEVGMPHHGIETAVSMGLTVWLTHPMESTFGGVLGMPISHDGCWWVRGAIELYKPIGPQPAGVAGILSLTRRIHRRVEVGAAISALLPFNEEVYHHPEGAGLPPREGVIVAAGPQVRYQWAAGSPTIVITPMGGYETNVGPVFGVSGEVEVDLTGAVVDLVRRLRHH
jgi:hypothetical protein